MGAKLIHIANKAWVNIELNLLRKYPDRILLVAATNADVMDIIGLVVSAENYDEEIGKRVWFYTEEFFKERNRIPYEFDSFLMSHEVSDVFFKSELSRKCGQRSK